MATLSCAMVGPMDGIHLLNKTRTMLSARADGYILKPDKPVSTVDACFKGVRRRAFRLIACLHLRGCALALV